jgi:hypothetical protein
MQNMPGWETSFLQAECDDQLVEFRGGMAASKRRDCRQYADTNGDVNGDGRSIPQMPLALLYDVGLILPPPSCSGSSGFRRCDQDEAGNSDALVLLS